MSGSSARDLQFGKNVAHMPVDCTRANRKRFRNFAIGPACYQQAQDFSFPVSKLAPGGMHRLFSFLYVLISLLTLCYGPTHYCGRLVRSPRLLSQSQRAFV